MKWLAYFQLIRKRIQMYLDTSIEISNADWNSLMGVHTGTRADAFSTNYFIISYCCAFNSDDVFSYLHVRYKKRVEVFSREFSTFFFFYWINSRKRSALQTSCDVSEVENCWKIPTFYHKPYSDRRAHLIYCPCFIF